MPNRGELPSPAQRAGSVATKSGTAASNAEAWTVVAFCTIGCLISVWLAVAAAGGDALPRLLAQVPLG